MPVTLDRGEAERLVHAYSDLILRLSYTYLKSTDDAQDICQTVFLKLLQKPRAFSSPEHEKAWIIRTAVNLCKDHLKSGWRRATVALDAAEAVPPNTAPLFTCTTTRATPPGRSPSFWAKSPPPFPPSSTADASSSAHS